jgi:hypothetical protein
MHTLKRFRQISLVLFVPLALFGQVQDFSVPEANVPAEVSQALRARVTEFFSYHTGAVSRKAIDLVAEDTKDYYFTSGKGLFLDVKITGADFSKDFQRASVHLETTQTMQVQHLSTVATTPVSTTWKLEDGKWMWYLDQQLVARDVVPMGLSAPAPPRSKLTAEPLTNPDGTLNIPKDFAEPDRVAAQGMAILSLAGLDGDTITFTSGKAEEAQVKFHNGFGGSVALALYEKPQVPGLTVTLSKSDLGRGEDAIVSFVYNPTEPAPANLLRQFTSRLELTPFNQEFPIKFTLIAPR